MFLDFRKKPRITMVELESHNHIDSAWVLLDGKIYDVTDFVMEHPGGGRLILENAGKDISYHAQFHSRRMKEILKPRLIGHLARPTDSI